MVAAPEDPLARMASWEALRRRVGDQSRTPSMTAAVASAATTSPLLELAEAARRVLDRHPTVAITITVESAGESASVQVSRAGGGLTVTVRSGTADTSPMANSPTHSGAVDSGAASDGGVADGRYGLRERAARLAELLRRDPTLLAGPERPA